MNVKILLAVALLASLAGHAAENSIAIVGATVIHPERELPAAVERDRTVLITGNRIVRIGPRAGTRVPAGAQRIDAKGKWVVPGLVDAHVRATCTRGPMSPTSTRWCPMWRKWRATRRACRRPSSCGSPAA